MTKVKANDFHTWMSTTWPAVKNQRLGQAFFNHFIDGGHTDPDLFYEDDNRKALDIIYERYIDMS